MKTVELRSDIKTLPTEEMLDAMRHAELGDADNDEDPTVKRLEALGASKVGKEAALYVPSGTMGNLLALMTHSPRGTEVILEAQAHILTTEVGGISHIACLMPRAIQGHRGAMNPGDVDMMVRTQGGTRLSEPWTSLICLEQTHNSAGGAVLPLENLSGISEVARRYNLPVHMDGARVFNASVALGVNVKEITKYVDSVMFCLSKGLSAPVGSLLAGSAEFIARARKLRKMIGGGMRQAGVIAAAGILALDKMTERLAEDHYNAKLIASTIASAVGTDIVAPSDVDTNMVMVDCTKFGMTPSAFAAELEKRGVRVLIYDKMRVRIVTHRGVTREESIYAAGQIVDVVNQCKGRM